MSKMRYLGIFILLLSEMAIADAQLFGTRTLGQPLGRQPRAAAAPTADSGRVTGSERFIRGNRDQNSFVGADQGETQSFVGSQQGSTNGVIVSSTAGIEAAIDRTNEINEVLETPPSRKMYLPKIILSPELIVGMQTSVKPVVKKQVRTSVNLASPQKIEVSVVNQTAILRGVVSSDKERKLAATLALFEPGIWKVENQLQVKQSGQPDSSPSIVSPRAKD